MSAAPEVPTGATEVPRLSPSIAHAFTSECPRQAWAQHRLLGNCMQLSDDQLKRRERGKALHSLVLEGGAGLEMVDTDSWRTKAAKEARASARLQGLIPILTKDADELNQCAERILESLAALGISVAGGSTEEKLLWTERSEHGDVACSGVIDWWSAETGHIVDLKTTEGSVHPDACAAALVKSPAVIQNCAYQSAVAARHPGLAGRTRMLFLFAQSREPYMITPVTCAGSMAHLGESRWMRAIESWSSCLAGGTAAEHWPQHTDRPIEVFAPAWALSQELELEAQEVA